MRIGLFLISLVALLTFQPVAEIPVSGIQLSSADELSAAIRTRIAASPPDVRAKLDELYKQSAYRLLWQDESGTITADGDQALHLLTAAGDEGLLPDDYRARALVDAAKQASKYGAKERASVDVDLSGNVLGYFHDLGEGRVDPRGFGFAVGYQQRSWDVVAAVRKGLMDHDLAREAAAARPQMIEYASLRRELARYRLLSASESAESLPSSPAVHPGERYGAMPALVRRLALVGDLASEGRGERTPELFAEPVVSALRRFQSRHGLEPDGVLGTRTQLALNVSLSRRIQQIELALERLRWLPRSDGRPLVLVNIPMFRLWAWDGANDGTPAASSAVIVGRASRGHTPTLVADMTEVIFRPYWNVPTSIVRHEILPLLGRQPDYFERQEMEIVNGESDAAVAVEDTIENRARLARGALRLRQRPGPKNALGLIKFVFPNEANVYLHDTPARTLFSRSRRDLSHGCVRVQNAIELAEWVLRDFGDWDRQRIAAAMNASMSAHVKLRQPVRVVLFYTTAGIWPDDATIHFAEDIYREDARLTEALARRAAGS